MISICPANFSSRRATIRSCKAQAAHASHDPVWEAQLPLASVGRNFTPGGTGREMEAGKTRTSAPAAAKPFTWCQAVVQIRSAPSRSGKLYKTRIRPVLVSQVCTSEIVMGRIQRTEGPRTRSRWLALSSSGREARPGRPSQIPFTGSN